jgi:hypothetical protein
VNRPNYPEGWAYDMSATRENRANCQHSNSLIGRILVWELPTGIGAQQIHQVCQQVPMPHGNENSWD